MIVFLLFYFYFYLFIHFFFFFALSKLAGVRYFTKTERIGSYPFMCIVIRGICFRSCACMYMYYSYLNEFGIKFSLIKKKFEPKKNMKTLFIAFLNAISMQKQF